MTIPLHAFTKRLKSLDVFRGLTIALMIIVNSPGHSNPYLMLDHSVWNGCTLADLVFPFFIVIVGMSSVLALSNLKAKGIPTSELFKKIVWRSAYIFFLGLLLNACPNHFDLETIRIPGVLQRIAVCYFFSAFLFISTRMQTQLIIMLVLLLGYACLMTFISPLGPNTASLTLEGNLVGYVDRLLLAPRHLYTPVFDPEGLLSTLPSIASALLGNLIGFCLISSKIKQQILHRMIAAGVFLALLGWAWRATLPLNKALWSSSYVLWTGGLALMVFSIIYGLIEIKGWIRWSKPFDLFGRHALLAYILHVLFLKIQAMIHVKNANGEMVGFRPYITDVLFHSFSPQAAALCYALSYTLLWLLVLQQLETWRKT